MRTVMIAIALAVVSIIGIGWYLAPNDLAGCTDHRPSEKEGCKVADAIVAVSGGDTIARTKEAINLYNKGWAPKLIFSGAAQDKSGPSNAEVMRQEALNAGVPASVIFIEEYSETTKQNAEKTQNIFDEQGVSSVILVTSAYHQRRAGLEFMKRSDGVTVRNHPVMQDNQWSWWWWATPFGWYLALGELGKVILFYLGGSR